jgi:hypothetical protein
MGILKRGDKVLIKSLDWYRDNCKNGNGVETEGNTFVSDMREYCGREATITKYYSDTHFHIDIDGENWGWTIGMVDLKEPRKVEPNYDFIRFGEFYIAFDKNNLIAIPEFFDSKEDFWIKYKKEGN